MSLRIISDGSGRPLRVAIEGKEGDVATIEAEAFESLGATLEHMRCAAGDGRYVCRTHGYHEPAMCPVCKEVRP